METEAETQLSAKCQGLPATTKRVAQSSPQALQGTNPVNTFLEILDLQNHA